MSQFRRTGNAHGFLANEFRFPDFEVSWAGACPWSPGDEGLCFGSEDGNLKFTSGDDAIGGDFPDIVDSNEAINGVAFRDQFMAVSTRAEVVLWNIPRPGEGKPRRAVYNGGAYDVVATASGRFVAPLGPNGLLVIKPTPDGSQPVKTWEAAGKAFNFYRAASLGAAAGGDVLVSAMRRDGIGTSLLAQTTGQSHISALIHPGLDIIDVCSLGSSDQPFAAAALGLDRSISLLSDALKDRKPPTFRFDGLEGTAYRILCAQGHIFILTSRCLYALTDLASRFLGGEGIGGPTMIRGLKIQAVDAYVAHNRWLLLVMPEWVYMIEVERLMDKNRQVNGHTGEATFGEEMQSYESKVMNSPWEQSDISSAWEQSDVSMSLATVG